MNPIATTLVVTLACLGGSATMQDQDPARGKAGKFMLKEGEHRLVDLVERVSLFLKHNYLHDEVARAGEQSVFLQNPLTLDERACEQVFSQLLYTKGFAIVPVSTKRHIYEIVAMAGPRRNEIHSRATWMTPEEVLDSRETMRTVMTSVALKHVNAQMATTALRPFFAASGGSGTGLIPGNVGHGRSLLLQGFAPSVAAAIELLARVDVPPASVDTIRGMKQRIGDLEARVKRLESNGK